MFKILVVHGPNLNLLGVREPAHYGHTSLQSLNHELTQLAKQKGVILDTFQSNSEGALIDKLHAAIEEFDYIIINPAGFTHTSVALRDALLAINIPFTEVHITNPYQREPYRHHSYFSDIATGVISGLGVLGYQLALQAALSYCNINKENNQKALSTTNNVEI